MVSPELHRIIKFRLQKLLGMLQWWRKSHSLVGWPPNLVPGAPRALSSVWSYFLNAWYTVNIQIESFISNKKQLQVQYRVFKHNRSIQHQKSPKENFWPWLNRVSYASLHTAAAELQKSVLRLWIKLFASMICGQFFSTIYLSLYELSDLLKSGNILFLSITLLV